MLAANSPTGASNAQSNIAPDPQVDIAVDDDDDSQSQLGGTGSVASSSTSVTDSVREFRLENGRTYHGYKAGKYLMPNDDREVERLDLQHNMFIHTFKGKLATAPPAQPGAKVGRALDVGTGSGIWAMDFADEHPEAEVRGFDLSPVQPEYTPPNLKFELDDLEEPWTFSRPFDYIHSRMMNGSIADWKEYLQKCYDNLTPGGYVELIEPYAVPLCDDGTLTPEHTMVKAGHLLIEATEKAGRKYKNISELEPEFKEVGFKDITIQLFKWPMNSWPRDPYYKELGVWNNENLAEGWEAINLAPLTRALGWTEEEALVFLAQNLKEFNDRSIHAYFAIWAAYGKRPEKDAEEDNPHA